MADDFQSRPDRLYHWFFNWFNNVNTLHWAVFYLQAVNCGTPVRPENGRIIGTDFTFQHTVEVQCGAGFYLQGPAQLTCNENAAWVGGQENPLCIGNI